MNTCSYRGCPGIVSGGFQKLLNASSWDEPFAKVPGLLVLWCDVHKPVLDQALGDGDYLSEDDLRAL
jgi:hypothetical protein